MTKLKFDALFFRFFVLILCNRQKAIIIKLLIINANVLVLFALELELKYYQLRVY